MISRTRFIALLLLFCCTLPAAAQKPKLVVGVVVDQMRWDYLYRYQDRYIADGFKRLLREGFSCENTLIPYTPTYTAPGHTCVYTGSVPSLHGIVGNNWYSRELGRSVYCTEDDSVQTVGSTSTAGKQSPRNMWASTITDELRLANNFTGKTIGIALKDRGAILPAGHTANAAYWFDNASGGFITSTFYMQQLPQWVQQFNARKLPDQYLKGNWKTLFPINTYRQSTADDKPYEGRLNGEDNAFDHITESLTNNRYDVFRHTPWGNSYTFEMAKAAIEGEQLGTGKATDFLALSFSSPDYIGHTFGPNSIEVEDTYLRFDREFATFLKYLDQKIGKGQYLLFLTADHGVAHVPAFAQEHKIPGGVTTERNLRQRLNDALQQEFNTANIVLTIYNDQVFLNNDAVAKAGLNRSAVKTSIIRELLKTGAVSKAFDLESINAANLPEKLHMMVVNGYNQRLSGDVQYIYKPQWFDGGTTGTTHGLWNPYDSHIPLVWFGWNIKPGKLNRETYMTDIAPTLAAMLQVQMPNANIGHVITEITSSQPAAK
ncbi:alkaline phosphatase PafA [Pseudocnuella soli]|uniref:alkaline phosphatase PafA n=1 Tax=Pseudocnuella soli TaxID=2502779 RepID=UPI00104CCEB9|nr:alkaline phosphatase PafA [Pseudocnuella soli]